MLDVVKSFSDTVIRLFVAYLMICFIVVACGAQYSNYKSSHTAMQHFGHDYAHFVVSQPNKIKKSVYNFWQKYKN